MKTRTASTPIAIVRSPLTSALLAVILSAAMSWSPGNAQESASSSPEIKIELNKLEASENACRAYLLLENRSQLSFESLKLDLVLFDAEGVVAKRLAVEAAPLPKDKTSLKVFNIAKLPCNGIGRVLLNKLTSCSDAQGARDDCLAMVSTSARGAVSFIK